MSHPRTLRDRIYGALCRHWRENCCSPTIDWLADECDAAWETVRRTMEADDRIIHEAKGHRCWRPKGMRIIIEAA